MKELSLHILDIAQNSISAGCTELELSLTEGDGQLTLIIRDNGRGMAPEFLASVTDPFTTTRTTRKVGLGLPLLRMAAEQTGGSLAIESTVGVGTTVTARFCTGHIDCPPLGDMAGTVALLVQGVEGQGQIDRPFGRSWVAGGALQFLRHVLQKCAPQFRQFTGGAAHTAAQVRQLRFALVFRQGLQPVQPDGYITL